jgi:general secretion pathway protein A
VDEAQNLSIPALEELRMLSNFQLGNHPLLQVLLLGQPEFRATLQGHPGLEQLRQRVIAAHHLEAMQQSEIEPYLTHRLSKVGWEGNPAFDQRVYHDIYEASGGIPRKINQIANRLLLLGAVEERTRLDSALLKSVLDEMQGEKAVPANDTTSAPQPVAEDGDVEAPAAAAPAATVQTIDPQLIEDLLAERDAQIAELQQAVVELATQAEEDSVAAINPDILALQEQVARLEAKSFEQERTIRQTLTMLIEWIEGEMDESRAA